MALFAIIIYSYLGGAVPLIIGYIAGFFLEGDIPT